MSAYATSTSVPQGGRLEFRLGGGESACTIRDAVTGDIRARHDCAGPRWTLDVPADWPSSLYAASFGSADPDDDVYFVVRSASATPEAILVSVPFLTWQAYNRAGVPGEGLYPTEGETRAGRVSFDRPGGGPAGHWEDRFYRWLSGTGVPADYCSNLDLHLDPGPLLKGRRLLVVAGHDEYWTAEMREAAESFVASGGNLAVFAGNTCWWQARLEDGGRTLVCHRDALLDPLAATDPARVTVEWSSAPVSRPENTLIGVSFRRGAGCWEDMGAAAAEAYTVRFAGHWVFEGTGLRDGDAFGKGCVGYETDAAEYDEVDGVPLVTGADGTPADFTILATADLRHWRSIGQGGHATLGIMRRGAGTVFNAATVGWGDAIDDPVIDRVTRNVLHRLGGSEPWWEPMGGGAGVTGLAACEQLLFGVTSGGDLCVRRCRTQNLPWRRVGPAPELLALAAPREATPGAPVLLYGLDAHGRVLAREPVAGDAPWTELYDAPPGATGIAPVDRAMYALGPGGELWRRPLAASSPEPWARLAGTPGLVALAHLGGRLMGLDAGGSLHAGTPDGWTRLGPTPGLATLTGTAGRLIGATPAGDLYWREPYTRGESRAPDQP